METSSGSNEFPREVRLGIVMYGGVSLAVYENGVAQELFRAVKGEGVYSFIKELIGSDIVVDIISGTSAGGVNGIFLGYALANKRDFRASATLWREDGDILNLLRRPNDPDSLSLLDSSGYYQPHLARAFAEMGEYTAQDCIESETVELDLFITATNVGGHIYTEFDGQGHPFSYTIDAIFHRTANREVDRMLLYVEPDPERFAEHGPGEAPNVLQAATDALLRIPGYQSIAGDLEAIANHNDRVARRRELYGLINRDPSAPIADHPGDTNPSDFTPLDSDPQRRKVYLRCRLAQLRDRAVEGILKRAGEKPRLCGPERDAAQVLVKSFAKLSGEGLDTLSDFDVYYRLRRLFHLTYFVSDILLDPSNESGVVLDVTRRRDLLLRLNHQIKLLEMIQFAMESLVDLAPIPYADLKNHSATEELAQGRWQAVLNLMRALLDRAGSAGICGLNDDILDAGLKKWTPDTEKDRTDFERTQRKKFMRALQSRIDLLSKRTGSEAVHPSGNVMHETDRLEREILGNLPNGLENPVAREYERFLVIDSYLFPMRYMAEIESTDVIRTVRISPIAAKLGFSDKTLNDKICGNELGRFGGFLKRSWRANDIMWGWLDAACQLVECLITPERMGRLSVADLARATARDLTRLFPYSPSATLGTIKAEIGKLNGYARDGDHDAFGRFLELVILAAQREILHQEVPRVLDASIRQQADWNQYDLGTTSALPPWNAKQGWTTGVRHLDRAITTYAAARLTQETKSADWVQYFGQNYKVGSEDWNADIPKPILLEIIASMALVLRNCLMGIAGPRAPQIRSSLLYKIGLNWPLLVSYHLIRLQRNVPEYVRTTFAAIAAACVSLLAVDAILWWMGSQYQRPKLLWVGSPIILLSVVVLSAVLLFRPLRRKAPPAPAPSAEQEKEGTEESRRSAV